MKVVIITNYWKNSAGGGVKTYLINLVEELKVNGIEVYVIFKEGKDKENFEIPRSKFFFSIKAFFILKRIKPNTIHSQGHWYCLLPAYLHKKIYGTKLIHTFHTEPYKKFSILGKKISQLLLNGCDCVTFVSLGLMEKIKEILELKFNKTEIVYAGAKIGKTSKKEIEEFKQNFGIEDNSIIILVQAFTAHPLKAKGLRLMIRVTKKLKEKYPNIILIATKEGVYAEELKKFVKKENVDDNVIFTGEIGNPFVPLLLCDIFVFPWLSEGAVGLALLEAMSVGKPIIVTSVSKNLEAIENMKNGFLVQPDVNSIVEKVEYILKNPELAKKLGENAKKSAEEKFTWKITAQKFLTLYKGEMK